MSGNPGPVGPVGPYGGDHFHKIQFNGPGIINDQGQLNITGNGGAGGSGGAGGAGGGCVVMTAGDLDLGSNRDLTGGLQLHDPTPKLQQEIDDLKTKVEELEKAESERKDIEYFQKNLKGALKIPEEVKLGWEIPKVDIGPNDILIIYFNVADVPSNRVESYMKRAKESLRGIFDERGLSGRTLWVATRERETGFGAIGIERPGEQEKLMKEVADYAHENYYWNGEKVLTKKDIAEARRILRKRKCPPPVMG